MELNNVTLRHATYKCSLLTNSSSIHHFIIKIHFNIVFNLADGWVFEMVSICLVLGQQPPSGPGPPHSRGFSITHNDAPQSAGLLRTSDQLVAETSTWQHTSLTTDRHPFPPGGIRTHNLSRRTAADLRLRPRGHWDWLRNCLCSSVFPNKLL